jgi:hypothetical protein
VSLPQLARSTLADLFTRAYDEEISLGEAGDALHAEPSEQATIDHMIHGITQIPSLITKDMQEWVYSNSVMTRLRNFASFVAQEETFPIAYKMQHGPQIGKIVEQKMLCISTKTMASLDKPGDAWAAIFKQKPGFQCSSIQSA